MVEVFKPNYARVLVPFLFIFPVLIFVFPYIGFMKNTKYKIDDKFLSQKSLFLRYFEVDIPISQITNVDYKIGWFWDKIFGTGTLKVYTAGTGGSDLSFSNVKNVVKLYDKINDLLKLNKSVKLENNGEFQTISKKHKLIERVKPNAKIATIFRFISSLISTVFIVIYIFAGSIQNASKDNLILIFIGGFILFVFVQLIISIFTYKTYKKKYFDFYDDKLEYYDGFFTLNKSTVPFERITNIEARQGLLDRIFGVGNILVETAGSSGAEIKISFVNNSEDIANTLKEVLKKNGRN